MVVLLGWVHLGLETKKSRRFDLCCPWARHLHLRDKRFLMKSVCSISTKFSLSHTLARICSWLQISHTPLSCSHHVLSMSSQHSCSISPAEEEEEKDSAVRTHVLAFLLQSPRWASHLDSHSSPLPFKMIAHRCRFNLRPASVALGRFWHHEHVWRSRLNWKEVAWGSSCPALKLEA